jgi:hypothetical protein
MSGNYQSRVFTFINKRTSRFKDTCAQGFRQIKIAVVWSGQALLYPFHLLAQTTKIFQPQITPPAQNPVLPPVSDINIEQALELVVDAGYPIVIAERGCLTTADSQGESRQQPVATSTRSIVVSEDSSNLGYYDPDTDDWEVASYSPRRSQPVVTKKPIIQGLSSLLIDRQLVLITTENEVLDILTSSQQQEIRRRIGMDLAIDWYQWSTGEILAHHAPAQLADLQQLSLADGHDRPLAIASGEDRSSTFIDRFQDWFQSLIAKPAESLAEPLCAGRRFANGTRIVQSSDITPKKLDRIASKSPRQIAPSSYNFTPQPPSIERFLDLPQLPPINEPESLIVPTSSIQQTLIEFQPQWLKRWWSYYREYLSIPTTEFNEFEQSQLIHQPAEFQLTKIEEYSYNIIKQIDRDNRLAIDTAGTNNISYSQSKSNESSGNLGRRIFQNVEHNPDWIETEAEQVGYSQSPIAKLLEWIDRLLFQVENWVIKTWAKINNNQSKV